MRKKVTGIIMSVVLSVIQLSNVFAALGDVEAHTTYTDILAYINHYLIESYNINGYTVVVAEDLANYGFNVEWDGNARILNITRNYGVNNISQYSIPYETAPNMVGKQALPVLSTDIKTYVNGVEAKSYNIDGKTVVDFESLSAFGPVEWHQDLRAIKLWVEDGLHMLNYMQKPHSLPKQTLYSADGRSIQVYKYEVDDYLNVGWYASKEEADRLKNAEKNKAALKNIKVGQSVVQSFIVYTRYGTVRSVDYNTGKVKIYWNYIEDAYGNEYNYLTASMFGLYSETWEDATSVRVRY